MTHPILTFTGPHATLSNFHPTPVTINGHIYPTAEHAFQAAKATTAADHDLIAGAPTPAEARRRGKTITLRPDWDTARHHAMTAAVAAKFTHPDAAAALLATGTALLIEGNTWHDQTWGQCTCPTHAPTPGHNHLGRALMAERAHLTRTRPDQWTRAAATGHRPHLLTADQATWVAAQLTRIATKLRTDHATTTAITGAARGTDTAWAHAAHAAGMTIWTYLPDPTQADRWPTHDQDTWAALRATATHEHLVADHYHVTHLHARNTFMLRDTDVLIAVHNPAHTTGGTATTLTAAAAAGIPTIVINPAARTVTLRRTPGPGRNIVPVTGNILTDPADALVNPVNTVGVMGKGLAAQFAATYPDLLTHYQRACHANELPPGGIHVWANPNPGPRWIINLATKDHWRHPSRLEWITTGTLALAATLRDLGARTVAIPALGAGLGHLPWPDVAAAITTAMATVPEITARVYTPGRTEL